MSGSSLASFGAGAAVDTNAIATAVAGAIDVPTVAENQSGLATSTAVATLQTTCNALPSAAAVATAVGAQAACAAALTAAAGAAIPSVAQNQAGLATASALSTLQTTCSALPSASAIATAVGAQAACAAAIAAAGLSATVAALTATAFSHEGADIEIEVLPAIPGSKYVLWGYEAYSLSGTTAVQWRFSSGVGIEDPGNVDVLIAGRIPASGNRIFPPGSRGLFVGQPSMAIFSKKDTGVDVIGTIWWTTIPN